MKRIHWYMGLGLPAAGLAAALLGQSVLGQPDVRTPATVPAAPLTTTTEPPMRVDRVPEFQPPASLPKPGQPSTPPPVIGTVQWSDPAAPTPPGVKAENKVEVGRQQPAVSLEWIGPPQIRIKQPMPCQIVVRNTSATAVHNVIVRHKLTQGVVCKNAEPTPAQDKDELAWNIGTLTPDQSRKIDLVLVAPTRGPLNCQATVTFSGAVNHQVQVREPLLAVKMRASDNIITGENVTLHFSISNPGDGVAEAIKLKAVLPDGLEFARGKIAEFDVGNLAPKETRAMQLVCLAKGTGKQKCDVSVTGEGDISGTDTCHFDILVPKLDITMGGPKLRYLERPAIYTLKVTNPGSAPISSVEVQEVIPAGFKFHKAQQGGQYLEATRLVHWKIGDLQPGESKEVAVDLIPIEAGEHRLVAQAKATRGLKSEAEVRTVVEGLPALSIDLGHADDPIEVGAETSYEIRIANSGTKTETNVQVVCTLPEQLEFKGAKCSATVRYRQEGRELIFEPLPKLAPKADVIFRIQVRGIAPGDARFRTKIRTDGLKEPVLREDSTRIYSDGAPARSTPPSVPSTSTPAPSALPTPPPNALPTPPSSNPGNLPVPTPPVSLPPLPTPGNR
jgi:hypothetical protein